MRFPHVAIHSVWSDIKKEKKNTQNQSHKNRKRISIKEMFKRNFHLAAKIAGNAFKMNGKMKQITPLA